MKVTCRNICSHGGGIGAIVAGILFIFFGLLPGASLSIRAAEAISGKSPGGSMATGVTAMLIIMLISLIAIGGGAAVGVVLGQRFLRILEKRQGFGEEAA